MVEQRSDTLVFVVKNLPPYRTHFLEHLALKLPEVRVAVVVTGGRPNQPWDVDPPIGVEIIEIPRAESGNIRRPGSVWAAWRTGGEVLAIIEQMHPIAVVVHGYDDPAHMRVIRGCHRSRIPVVLRADSNIRGEDRKTALLKIAKRWLLRFGFHYVDAFMPVGSNGSAYFQHYGIPDNRIFIVPLEPLYPLFSEAPSATAVEQFQKRFGLVSERRRILYVGRLVPVKRVDLLIEAFADIASRRPAWDLLIAGDGPAGPSLRALVPDALQDRVSWTGFLNPMEVRLAHASSSIFVLPSESEPWGLVVNEAIAAGLAPVLSDAVGAAADLVPDSEAGWVFPVNDREALATALMEATVDERAAYRSAAARRHLHAFRESHDSIKQVRMMLKSISASA